MESKITVIIPVYNVERYIRNCLDSVLNQTYKNLEIIIVDDGTPDNAGRIADEYAKKDERIIVVHKENGGLSTARNCGLDNATGEYVTFIDSDDYISSDYIEILYNLITKYNADISECDLIKINEEDINKCSEIIREENNNQKEIIELKSNKEALELLYGVDYYKYIKKVIVCNKLYKKQIFDNIRFPIGRFHEDEFTTLRILYSTKEIVSTNRKNYGYIQSKNSIMRRTIQQKRIEDNLEAYYYGIQYFTDRGENRIASIAKRRYLENCIELYGKVNKESSQDKKLKLNYIKDLYNKYYNEYIKDILEELIKNSKEEVIANIINDAYNTQNIEFYWEQLDKLVKEKKD